MEEFPVVFQVFGDVTHTPLSFHPSKTGCKIFLSDKTDFLIRCSALLILETLVSHCLLGLSPAWWLGADNQGSRNMITSDWKILVCYWFWLGTDIPLGVFIISGGLVSLLVADHFQGSLHYSSSPVTVFTFFWWQKCLNMYQIKKKVAVPLGQLCVLTTTTGNVDCLVREVSQTMYQPFQ